MAAPFRPGLCPVDTALRGEHGIVFGPCPTIGNVRRNMAQPLCLGPSSATRAVIIRRIHQIWRGSVIVILPRPLIPTPPPPGDPRANRYPNHPCASSLLYLCLGVSATLPYPLAVPEEDEGKGQHRHSEEGEQTRCPLIAELLVHLHAKQGEGGWLPTSRISSPFLWWPARYPAGRVRAVCVPTYQQSCIAQMYSPLWRSRRTLGTRQPGASCSC